MWKFIYDFDGIFNLAVESANERLSRKRKNSFDLPQQNLNDALEYSNQSSSQKSHSYNDVSASRCLTSSTLRPSPAASSQRPSLAIESMRFRPNDSPIVPLPVISPYLPFTPISEIQQLEVNILYMLSFQIYLYLNLNVEYENSLF